MSQIILGSFLAQSNVKGYQDMETSSSFVVVSGSAKLPMLQTYGTPVAHAFAARSLTIRETEILELLGKGLSMKGTARDLAISPGTVKWHVKNLYEKLGASSREDALFKARLSKLIR